MYAVTTRTLSLTTLVALLFSGCATTESVSERTAPLEERITALDSSVDAGLRGTQATALDARRLAEQANARLNDLESRFAGQSNQLATIQRDIARMAADNTANLAQLRSELRNDLQAMKQAQSEELASNLARQSAALESQLKQQLSDQLATQLAQAEKRITTENQIHTETRIKEVDAGLNSRMDQLEKRMAEVARMAEEALAALGLGPRKIYGKVVHSATLTDDKTMYPINSPELGSKDMAKLDAVAEYVKKLDVNYHIGIHGHTDGLGSDDYNYELGKARADVVKNYLHEKKGIPLLRMSVISHGATDVSAYRQGSNRRIVVEVLQ